MRLNIATAITFFVSLSVIFFYAPIEKTQGLVQKIFYVHVSSAITMYIGFFLSFLGALMYLIEKKTRWDEISVAGAEVGYFFCSVVLLTGPIWARPIWGVWWDWEPRLTTTFLLWLLYTAYLLLRGYFGATARGRLVASVVTIIAFLDVPLVHLSVRLWRGVHPSVIGPEGGGIPTTMKQTLLVTFVSVLFLFAVLFRSRFRLERLRNKVMQLRLEAE